MAFDLDNYNDVAARITECREKYPDGSLQPADLSVPYRIEVVGGQAYVAYVAAFYRTPDDRLPGIGTAWEPVPGRTPYTKDSELQNAETSAWGRAMVAALKADTKKGIASQEEVRARRPEPATTAGITDAQRGKILALFGNASRDERLARMAEIVGRSIASGNELTKAEASKVIDALAGKEAPENTRSTPVEPAVDQPSPIESGNGGGQAPAAPVSGGASR